MQARLEHGFKVARSRTFNEANRDQYVLSTGKKTSELETIEEAKETFKNALFYMHGQCEKVTDGEGKELVVHSLLKTHGVWSGSDADCFNHFKNQIVVTKTADDEDDGENDLSQEQNIIRFLNNNSKFGKTIKEIEEVGETLSAKLYKVAQSEDSFVIKVPKKLPESESDAFLDIVYQTQLIQLLDDTRQDGVKQFLPQVHEEIFVVSSSSNTILNYVAIVE